MSKNGCGGVFKEINRGIYEAIGRKDIPLMASDLKEPESRPGFKIYVRPVKSERMNNEVRVTEYDIMVLYYARDVNDYYLEHYEMEEAFEEMLLGVVELDNGVFIELNELEFESEGDLLAVYMKTTVDTRVDSELDDEVMEELELKLGVRNEEYSKISKAEF